MSNTFKQQRIEFVAALQIAWALLIEIPVPFVEESGREQLLRDRPQSVMWCFPILGVLCGLALTLLGWFCGLILPHMGALVLFSLLGVILLELKDRGATLALSASLVEQKMAGASWHASFSGLENSWHRVGSPLATLVPAALLLIKLAALGVLFYFHHAWFLCAVLVLNFTVQGALAMEHSLLNGVPLLPVRRTQRSQIWYLALFFLLFNAIGLSLATLVAAGGAYLGYRLLRLYWLESYDGVDANMITLAGGWTECWALLCALLLAWC